MKNQESDLMLELHVPDFEVAKDFYSNFGFKLVWERRATSEETGYMVLRRAKTVLCFYAGDNRVYEHSYFGRWGEGTKRGYGVEIIIPIDGIKSFYQNVQLKQPNSIVQPLKTRYSHPDFRVEDPFGFYLRFVERYNWVDTRNVDGTPKEQ